MLPNQKMSILLISTQRMPIQRVNMQQTTLVTCILHPTTQRLRQSQMLQQARNPQIYTPLQTTRPMLLLLQQPNLVTSIPLPTTLLMPTSILQKSSQLRTNLVTSILPPTTLKQMSIPRSRPLRRKLPVMHIQRINTATNRSRLIIRVQIRARQGR